MREKIGLITIWQVPNYGSVLQAYATQVLIENLGYKCEIINYNYPNNWHYRHGMKRRSIKNQLVSLFGLKPIHRKQNKLIKFKKQNFKLTRKFKDLEDLQAADWSDYSAIAVGSDQVWNYRFNLADSAFLLSFVPNEIRRISIASSFAVNSIPQELSQKYRRELSKFTSISVRERNGIDIITNDLSLGIKPEVLLDPTLLLDKDQWLSIIPRSSFVKKKKYILLYMLTYAFEPRPYIFDVLKFYQEKFGYDIYALEGYNDAKQVKGLRIVDKTDSSLSEFIDLFANADLVVTSSFHGTAFAINFGVPLVSIVPNDLNSDDRQLTLLKKLNLEKCCATTSTPIQDIDARYNSELISNNLSLFRERSIAWLSDALAK